jgi:hypothetical protein
MITAGLAGRVFCTLRLLAETRWAGCFGFCHSGWSWLADMGKGQLRGRGRFRREVGRYRGLRHNRLAALSPDAPTGLLVRPEIAKQTTRCGDQAGSQRTLRNGWPRSRYRAVPRELPDVEI